MGIKLNYIIQERDYNFCNEATSSVDWWGKYNSEKIGDVEYKLDYYIQVLDKLDFYYNDKKASISKHAAGYYSTDDYYCVWTRDELPKTIWETDTHEQFHALLHKKKDSYKHFCELLED